MSKTAISFACAAGIWLCNEAVEHGLLNWWAGAAVVLVLGYIAARYMTMRKRRTNER